MRTRILLSTLLAFLPVVAGAADAAAPAVAGVPAKPSPRAGDADFPMPSPSARHAEKVAAVRSGRFDLALIGDSITHTVGELGGKYEPLRAVWDKHFAPRRAINLGHNGQRTENILWNLADGELDFVVSPKVVVVLIGTNNSDDRNFKKVHTAEEIADGTRAIVDLVRRRHPATKVLVVRVFPRGGDGEAGTGGGIFHSSAKCIATCLRAGELTRKLADGKNVFWIDVGNVFLRPDGTIDTDRMPDLLHPGLAGAEAWAEAIEPTLTRLMAGQAVPAATVIPPRAAAVAVDPLPEKLALWAGKAPDGAGATDTADATITVFRAAKPNGAAMVICPGGGYGGLVTGAEGTGIARWLGAHGITGIVLEYRLPRGRRMVPLLDAQRAIRTARANADRWGIDPGRIGIIGFSAGGHLASTAATHFAAGEAVPGDPVARFSSRPDFSVLVYPVISMGAKGHGGSRQNLLGLAPTADQVRFFSSEEQVAADTAPSYLAHAVDDRAVSIENSRMFAAALGSKGVASRLLELPSGDHGLDGYQGPMWDAWQSGALRWLAERQVIPVRDAADAARSAFRPSASSAGELASGPQQVRLLPGHDEFVFSMYGAPGDLGSVRQIVDAMREMDLGNGFDPGPGPGPDSGPVLDFLSKVGWPVVFYSGGEMQIKGGRAVFGPAQEASLAAMDRARIFTAYQLGEWGYYFHNLAPKTSWWHDVYGADFEAHKHLMKPEGLAGFDRMPADKKEAHDVVRDYFASRSRDLLGRVISVTGHSHYEAYAGPWGARSIGLEVGHNHPFTQAKPPFARGASRSWQRPWSVQVSPWFGASCTTSGPLREEGGILRGLDAGHSLSFYERTWLHGWFAGAAMVTPENSIATFFEQPRAPWVLTSHGRKAAEVFRFMRSHDRGVPFAPVAVVLDRHAGYNGYMDKPWGILPPTAGDREVRDLFDRQLFPGSDHIHLRPDPEDPESSYLRPTPIGEIFDVLLTSVPPEVLPSYPVILLAGDITFDDAFLSELEKALRRGSRVLMSARHREALGSQFGRVAKQGAVEVLEPWTNPATGRATAMSNARLAQVAEDVLPVEVTGDAVQHAVNRTAHGWVVELVNDRGVTKKPRSPAVTDPSAISRVVLRSKAPFASAKEWRSGEVHSPGGPIAVVVPPGGTEFIEFTEVPR